MLKKTNGKWVNRLYLSPSYRPRKSFDRKADAIQWEIEQKAAYASDPEKAARRRDGRRLSELIALWYDAHGANLKDGTGRRTILDALAAELGDPLARHFTASHFAKWRAHRKENTPNTLNRKHAYLRAVFNELIRLGEWHGENPLDSVRQFAVDESELAYLDPSQVADLLAACQAGRNPHTYLVACLCLATGARWSEAETLPAGALQGERVTYAGTKSGKSRTVPIAPRLAADLQAHRDGRARFFGSCYAAFGKAVQRAGIVLPRGQLAHVLRHTFATHFMQHSTRSDALLTLQRLLGHSDIKLTLRYAHMAPDYLQEAVKTNPLGQFWDNGGN